jgi:hypothetical protein
MTRKEAIQTHAPVGSEWAPKNRPKDSWKVVNHYFSEDRDLGVVELEKYQGGRNSPTYLPLGRLMRYFQRKALKFQEVTR